MNTHRVDRHIRGGSVVEPYDRQDPNGRPSRATPEQAAAAKSKAVAAAEAESAPESPRRDPKQVAEMVGPLLQEEFIPKALGEVKSDRNGFSRPSSGDVIERAQRVGAAVGMDPSTLSELSDKHGKLKEALDDQERARQFSNHHDDHVVRRGCEHYFQLTEEPEGDLYEAASAFDMRWSDFVNEFVERAGPRMIDDGLVVGHGPYNDYEMAVWSEDAYEHLVGGEPELATIENTTVGGLGDVSPELAPPEVMDRLIEEGRKARTARETDDSSHKAVPVVKWQAGPATWLVSEADPDHPDQMFGLADLGMGCPEMGYFSRSEIESVGGAMRAVDWEPNGDLETYWLASREAGEIVELPAASA